MVYYLEYFSPFSQHQGLPEDDLIDIVYFALPCEWQKQLLVQDYESSGKDLYEIFELCERLDTAKDIYDNQGERKKHNKNLYSPKLDTNNPSWLEKV